jgi:peptidoglycan/LPS O-acetylase OafA/YrhL
MDSRRIASIDGLRTVAILAVVAYHYCYRWGPPVDPESLYPYGTALAGLPGVRFGGYGVHLFFVISGFVIAMTLERCKTAREFILRRYARLAPAMLLFSVITFAAMHLIPRAPFPERGVWFLSSITFIDPVYLNRIAPGIGFYSIDGAYWSLYVEVQFYVLACLAYFMARDHFRPIMGLLSAIACGLFLVRIPLASPISNNLLIPSYLPWFLMGVGFHALALRSQWAAGLCLVSLGTLELLAQDVAGVRHAVPAGVVMLVPILFAAAVWFRPFVAFLSWKPIVTIGAASYGLYLIHENVGVSILHSLPSMGAAAGAIAAVAVAAGCCAVAVASFRWIETPVSRLIRTRLSWAVRERAVAGEWQRAARTGEGRRQLLSQLAAGDAYRPNIPTRRAATSPQPRR